MNNNFENSESFQQLPEELKEFFRQLPEETKARLSNCKNEEEAMDVLKGDMIPLSDDVLDAVAGGEDYWCVDCVQYCSGYEDPACPHFYEMPSR